MSGCPVTRGEVDLSKYDEVDGAWMELGLGAPAGRALVNAHLFSLEDLCGISLKELKSLHGMGPSTIKVLVPAMDANGLHFKS
jgi:hypothetical protein